MPLGYDLFSNIRINSVMQGLVDPRTLPGEFVFSKRVPTVPAQEGDITARFIQYPQVADLIADDQRAVVYQTGKFQLQVTKVPNLKIGANMTQTMLNQVRQILANPGGMSTSYFEDWESSTIENLRLGIQERVEILLVAMMTDSFVYDRLGLKLSATWAMPAGLKATVSPTWVAANQATAKPITDILTMRRYAQVVYGINLNRLTMSLVAFNLMVATQEFIDRSKAFIPIGFSLPTQYATQNTDQMRSLASRILDGIEIVLYDQMYWTQGGDNAAAATGSIGTYSMVPYLPINKVVFDNSNNDGNRKVWDLANTEVTEATVASLGGEPLGQSMGPVSYSTFPENLNPPNINYWAVQRCFPRKHLLQANACFTVWADGAVTDPIGTVVPF